MGIETNLLYKDLAEKLSQVVPVTDVSSTKKDSLPPLTTFIEHIAWRSKVSTKTLLASLCILHG